MSGRGRVNPFIKVLASFSNGQTFDIWLCGLKHLGMVTAGFHSFAFGSRSVLAFGIVILGPVIAANPMFVVGGCNRGALTA